MLNAGYSIFDLIRLPIANVENQVFDNERYREDSKVG